MPAVRASSLNQPSPQLYNGFDCCLTYEIHEALETLNNDANTKVIYDFELALQGPAMLMMTRGVKVDPFARMDAIRKLEADRDHVENMLKRFTEAVWSRPYDPKFPNSGKQLKEFFYGAMGLAEIASTVKGEYKVQMDRKVLEKLNVNVTARPFISCILSLRDIAKQLQVLKTEVDPDWRMRTSFNIAGTSTGRWSSSKAFNGTGGNFQNVTEDLRHVFVADPGYKLVGIDKEQAEAREVGYLCGVLFDDWKYLDACESGDPHTYVARLIWPELGWNGDKKHDRQIAEQVFYRHFTYRDLAKRCAHATNYYGKAFTISSVLRVPIGLIQKFQTRYFEVFPAIPMMHKWIAQQLQTKQYLVNVFGRRRDFFDRPDSEETLRGAIAYMFQSATADDMNLGLWRLWKHMEPRIQILLQLHDAVYFQFALTDNEEDVIRTAQSYLNVELRPHNAPERSFIVPTDAKSGFNLRNRYKYNDQGIQIEVNKRGLDKVKWT